MGLIANRRFTYIDDKTKETKESMHCESISEMENMINSWQVALGVAYDPNISISSANPNQYVGRQQNEGNQIERTILRREIRDTSRILASRRAFIYQYVLQKYYELKYSGIADDIFTRNRLSVDQKIGELIPDAVQKFTAAYENLQSTNPEDWSNAVHSCRRIFQDLADAVFPATEDRTTEYNGKTKTIKLGKDNYKNRIIAFVEASSDSERFREIVGSNLEYIGERLDSIYEAANKGTHTAVSKAEADRYVVYTYLLVGDILSLK